MKREILQPKTKTLFNLKEEPIISFRDANQVVGQFRIVNGVLTFEGNTDKSADVFIKFLCETFKIYTEEDVLNILLDCEWITKNAKIKYFNEKHKK